MIFYAFEIMTIEKLKNDAVKYLGIQQIFEQANSN